MLVVVGGHSRDIGKTSVVAGLIRALPEAHWTAMKITQYGHGICSTAGEACECSVQYEHPYALSQEQSPGDTDSGRFLAAGAQRSYWLRTAAGQLGHAVPAIRRILQTSENAIFESNSVLEFFEPDLYLVVLDFSLDDLKDSSRRYLDRADAFVVIDRGEAAPPWKGIPAGWLEQKARFPVRPPQYVSPEVARFVQERLSREPVSRPGETRPPK